ncbi:NADPH-dependent FMN reductase [Gallaecimonas pentaromativorans]|uniref:NAD(P)H-dependent FMN reductase n=1 Tax=Gallaecimonas pentaromativorans TaxID=584787 RepID=A0A3N1NS56_9GAMM|nr:NAD(P)H-dependent oxidoreductase [Gallaecimonas pentaromativorans]MED5525002.1 NAD(P)H-dependent oxidoreductase [Pseudomonadota bacterium]ROQ18739.1 NAD(P)H-dependent FMN reductase [Gallaecimonas pentaromativorans]
MTRPKLVFLAGSARKDSLNKKLAAYAAKVADQHGADVTLVDLADYPMPLYDGDLEATDGIPANAKALRDLFAGHDGFCIASPEYNSAFSPLLKNTIDWMSRPDGAVPGLVAFHGKTAQLLATSPGGLGGLRGLVMLRMLLGNIGVLVMPDQLAIPAGHEAFDADGSLKAGPFKEMLAGQLSHFVARSKA